MVIGLRSSLALINWLLLFSSHVPLINGEGKTEFVGTNYPNSSLLGKIHWEMWKQSMKEKEKKAQVWLQDSSILWAWKFIFESTKRVLLGADLSQQQKNK